MIWVTGDIHGDPSRLSSRSFDEQEFFEKQDENFVIILGDFGLVWNYEKESKTEKWWLDWLAAKPFYTLFISGNHENFDRLDKYPVSEWNGGKGTFHPPSCDPFDARTSIQYPRQNILYLWRRCKS